MKKINKNSISMRMFFSFAAFSFSIYGCAAWKPTYSTKPIKIEGGKENLVERDIGAGLPYSLIRWCGNDALLIYGEEFGTQWVDTRGNKATISTNSADYPEGCTPDGKFVLYKDRNSAREYRDKEGSAPENIVDEGPGWHGSIIDLYRYEIATGTRQKFAVVRDDSAALVSPDGSKVLLGNRHDSDIGMPEPIWEKVWLTNELDSGLGYAETFWFADASGIAVETWGDATSSLVVKIFGDKGWTKEFGLEYIGGRHKAVINVSLDAVDKDKRLYFSTIENPTEVKQAGWAKYRFFRCEIANRKLSCEKIGELDEAGKRISSLYLLSNGDVIFGRWREDGCIRRLKLGQAYAECITEMRYGDDYEDISLIGVSPDEKWIAVRRGKTSPRPRGKFYGYQYDLFVKELSQD